MTALQHDQVDVGQHIAQEDGAAGQLLAKLLVVPDHPGRPAGGAGG